jgi:hypothetical protein
MWYSNADDHHPGRLLASVTGMRLLVHCAAARTVPPFRQASLAYRIPTNGIKVSTYITGLWECFERLVNRRA